MKLLDWVNHTRGHASWFYEDGLHPSHVGAGQLARYVARAKQWYPKGTPCGAATATALAGTTAGTPLCSDFTSDRTIDMVVPLATGNPAEVRSWRMYVQHGVTWNLAWSDDGGLLAPQGALPPYALATSGLHGLTLAATLPAECDGCPVRPWQFVLGWRKTRFAVESHAARVA